MTAAAAVAPTFTTPQIEGANFLNLLIVDDERADPRSLPRSRPIARASSTLVADSAEHAYRLLDARHRTPFCSICGCRGRAGWKRCTRSRRRPEAVVIVVTGYGTVQSAVQAMKNGAYDYVTKPFSMEELQLLLERVASHLQLKTENRMLREKIKSKQGFGPSWAARRNGEALPHHRQSGAQHPSRADSGRKRHRQGNGGASPSISPGPFRDKPFIPVDCGSLVPTLIESELFGYVKGAFTGANQSQRTACWPSPKAAPCFSTRSANCRSTCRPNCCALFRKRKFARWEARNAFRSTCAFWPPPTATWNRPWPRAPSAATCTSGSTS